MTAAADQCTHAASAPLRNIRILTTRPANQCHAILARLTALGAQAQNFPTIEIIERTLADDIVASVSRYDLAIFISGNAVDYGLLALARVGVSRLHLPVTVAVGRGTARLLEAEGVTDVHWPPTPGSESLLQIPAVSRLVPPARAVLFRGVGGREWIAAVLRGRGIEVDYAEVYIRCRPARSLTLGGFLPELILVTSREGLQNLYDMAPGATRRTLLRTPVLLGSPSMLELHSQLGFERQALVASSPLDEDMVSAVLSWSER